jgi:hypothetical protein
MGFFAAVLCAAGVVSAASSNKVVTNPTPAVSATMELVAFADNQFVWEVSGKVKPGYRGFGANVKLVCQQYNNIGSLNNPPLVFPQCTTNDGRGFCDPDAPNVDGCGNFTFQVRSTTANGQLANTAFCNFVVHVDTAHQPSACSARFTRGEPPEDPNGTAPCSGGFCPDAQ